MSTKNAKDVASTEENKKNDRLKRLHELRMRQVNFYVILSKFLLKL